jgi:hypothetical protein
VVTRRWSLAAALGLVLLDRGLDPFSHCPATSSTRRTDVTRGGREGELRPTTVLVVLVVLAGGCSSWESTTPECCSSHGNR